MITQELYKIQISKVKAEKMVAYTSHGAVYDASAGELSFNIKRVSKKSFRLIYNNTRIWTLIEGDKISTTLTIFEAEEFETEQEALDWIIKSELEYDNQILK